MTKPIGDIPPAESEKALYMQFIEFNDFVSDGVVSLQENPDSALRQKAWTWLKL